MPYYHVRIIYYLSDKSGSRYYDTVVDLSIEELEQRFLAPYRRGKPITINGKTMRWDDIDRILIGETEHTAKYLRTIGKTEDIRSAPFPWNISGIRKDVTNKFITGSPGYELDKGDADMQQPCPPINAREVFVIHGRNQAARNAMFDFLRAIDLRPLEWSEAVQSTGKPTPYVGEILDAAFSKAHAVVVLLTPDDEARLREPFQGSNEPPHETELTGQARPNVLFEAGMAMGRSQDRTIIVELGDLRPFSDVAGRYAIRLDKTSEKRQELAQRLQASGCPVNLDGTDWHSAGNFEAALLSNEARAQQPAIIEEHQPVIAANPQLSEDATILLVEAAKNNYGMIRKIRMQGGLAIMANGKPFAEMGNRRSEARWEGALNDLLNLGLVKNLAGKGQAFEVTREGLEVADSLESP